jgi:hypothetical protein
MHNIFKKLCSFEGKVFRCCYELIRLLHEKTKNSKQPLEEHI